MTLTKNSPGWIATEKIASIMKYSDSQRVILGIVYLIAMFGSLLIHTVAASAFTGGGQLTFARQVTINEHNAVSGQTVFDGTKIKVGSGGTAIISLGRQGRVELGANSEMVLLMAGNNIAGTVTSGCLAINAPAGTSVKIDVLKGKVSSVGSQPSFFIIEVKADTISVSPNLGEIEVTVGHEIKTAGQGQMITILEEAVGNSPRRFSKLESGDFSARCACENTSAPRLSATSQAESHRALSSAGLLDLLFTVVNKAKMSIWGESKPNTNPSANGSGLTCINMDGVFCKPIGPTTP